MASKGKRFNDESNLNYNKIFAVIIFIAVIIMFAFGIKKLISTGINSTGKISTINYFSVYSNGKWGVINSEGETIIEPQYDEMIVIPDNSKPIFICTYNVNYDTGEYNTKVINNKNDTIITGYDNVNFIDYLDEKGNIVYLDKILKVEKNKKYGLVDLSGKEILPIEYDEITLLEENSLLLEKDELFGICDYEGNIIIKPEYIEIQGIANDYRNGYITVDKGNLYGIIDFNKSIIFDNKYLDIKSVYSSSKYAVKIDKKYQIVDRQGKIISKLEFDDVKDIDGEQIIYKEKNKYGISNINGEKIIPAEYEDIMFINNNYFIAQKDEKYGIISTDNNVEIEFKYDAIDYSKKSGILIATWEHEKYDLYNSELQLKLTVNEVEMEEDYMKVILADDTKFYNFKFEEISSNKIWTNNTLFASEKNGKYGFVDSKGNVVIDYQYDEVTEYNKYGFAGVKVNELWGAINLKGETVVKPKYNLNNNRKIDFIGKWHNGIDSNYYTDM